jgi:uncharacterized short protein YbdD (DUF466 family)
LRSFITMAGIMGVLRDIWVKIQDWAGENDYARYCEHLRRRHPGREVPSAKEFYLSRLQDRYSRPSRCC